MAMGNLRDLAANVVFFSLIGGITYSLFLAAVPWIISKRTRKITSQKQLEEAVLKESEKLGLTKKINPRLVVKDRGYSEQQENGSYTLVLGGNFANVYDVKHEVYHIHKGHCDFVRKYKSRLWEKTKSLLRYVFRDEPQAVIYGCTGIKL